MKSIVCGSLSIGVVGEVRSMLGHNEDSARKLVGTGCSELWRVHNNRRSLSSVTSVPRGCGGYVKEVDL